MLVHPDDQEAALKFKEIDHVVAMCEESSGTVRREMRIRSLGAPDDDYRWAMIRILHTKEPKKDEDNLFVILNDINERRQREIERLESTFPSIR